MEYYSSRGISTHLLSVEQVYTTYAQDLKYKIADHFLSYIDHEIWILRNSIDTSKGLRFIPNDTITQSLFLCCAQSDAQKIFDYFTLWTKCNMDGEDHGFEIILIRENLNGEYYLRFIEWERDYRLDLVMSPEEAREVVYRLVQLKVDFTDIYEHNSIPYPE